MNPINFLQYHRYAKRFSQFANSSLGYQNENKNFEVRISYQWSPLGPVLELHSARSRIGFIHCVNIGLVLLQQRSA